MTAVLEIIQGVPWMYVLVAASLMFGGVATGLVRFDEWLAKRPVKEKIAFSKIRVIKGLEGKGYGLDIEFNSSADISVKFEVEEIRTRLVNRVPEK